MKIQARVLAMAEAEILGMISPRTLRDIKLTDPSPTLMAFVVGQEGEARPKVVGLGATIQRWFNSAIEALIDRLPLGIPAYHDHPQASDVGSRQAIGEIVGKALRHVQGTLSAIAVAYIYPQFKALKLDVASIEADILIPRDSHEFEITDGDVQQVTGIALGNSANDSPAFPGATLIAQLQAFAEKNPLGGDTKMTTAELQQTIREAKLKPSDLFNSKEIEADPSIVELMKENTPAGKEFARMRQELKEAERNVREAEIKVGTLEREKKDLTEKVQVSERQIIKGESRTAFDALVAERPKLKEDARLLKYVTKGVDKGFQPTDAAKLKDELNKFVDDQVKEYQDLFGDSKPVDKPKPKPELDAGDAEKDVDLEELKKSELFPKD
jgi:hypothetical protein